MQIRRPQFLRTILSSLAIVIALSAMPPAFAEAVATEKAPDTAVAISKEKAEKVHPWGFATNDLTADPSIRLGVLPNGMKYAIQKNLVPKGGAAVRLYVDAGYTSEPTTERGIAHFLEHMNFNGSTNIPEGELVKKLQRLGLAFGADTNAFTYPDHTRYVLDLPKSDDETVDTALQILRETAGELTISSEAVDRERGILESERQTRDSMDLRLLNSLTATAFPGTPIAARKTTDSPELIKNVKASEIREFYQRYYRPENSMLAMVGDFDVEAIELKIRQRFSDWKGKGPAGSIDRGTIMPASEPALAQFVDPDATVIARFIQSTPYRYSENTIAEQRQVLLETIGAQILTQRIDKLGRTSKPQILGGIVQRENVGRTGRWDIVASIANGEDWQTALILGEQELRRAIEHGFTQSELDTILTNIRANMDSLPIQRNNWTHAFLANNLIESAANRSVVMSAEDIRATFNKFAPTLTVDALNTAFREVWGKGPSAVHIAVKKPIDNFADSVRSILADSAKVAVAAPQADAALRFAYDDFGKPGKVKSDKRIADLNIRTVRFANGVMLNLRKTDFESGAIHFGVRIGRGRMALGNAPAGSAFAFIFMSQYDGLKAHGIDDLQKLMAGHRVKLGLNAENDAFGVQEITTPADLELQLKLLAAYIQEPGFRPETEGQWKNLSPILAKQLTTNPMALASVAIPGAMAGNDAREGMVDPSALAKVSFAALEAPVRAELARGPIEIALVGDVNEEAAIRLVGRTLGALPKRNVPKKETALEPLKLTTERKSQILIHGGKDDQGVISINWPTTDDADIRSALTRDVLAEVFNLMLIDIVREKMEAAYTPNIRSVASDSSPGFGYISSMIVAEPEKMEPVAAAIRQIAQQLRDQPVSEDMLLRARKPIAERYDRAKRENAAWVALTNVAQSEPYRLERRRKRASTLAAITVADVRAMAQQYLLADNAVEFRLVSRDVAAKLTTQ